MHDQSNMPSLISAKINSFLSNKRNELTELGPDLTPLFDELFSFLRGGKRLRGQFLLSGFETVSALAPDDESEAFADITLNAAAALEIFHAAALIHDDIIDNSDTRRGAPAVHKAFETYHKIHQLQGSPARFGLSTAILLGDILQSWADELMNDALDSLPSRVHASNARKIFNKMRSEVAAGQYLDVLEESRPEFAASKVQLERSTRVLVYKSAKYSVQAPLMLGGAIAGAREPQMVSLAEFGLPIGVAFQLRDDILGTFGEEKVTGKPSGDDLREGKRTILVTLAREKLPNGPRRVFDDLLGNPDLDEVQIKTMQRTIEDTGARERIEQMIKQNVGLAREVLHESSLRQDAVSKLIALADSATARDS